MSMYDKNHYNIVISLQLIKKKKEKKKKRILSDGEVNLNFPGGSRVITEVLMREGRGRRVRVRDVKTPHCWL